MQTVEQLLSGELKGTDKLTLSCGLKEFPMEILELSDTLEFLDLSGNELSELPADFGRLSKLKILFLSFNKFTKLPEVLAQCHSLTMIGIKANQISDVPENALPLNIQWLILTNNQIEKLPKSIGKCKKLQKVMLAGNQLKELPKEMANCKNIELLRISANQLTAIPQWIFKLPRLSWLAYSGNPCCHTMDDESELQRISWSDIHVLDQLGEGGSGVVYKATCDSVDEEYVAVKIFKGEVTSDGYPEDELHMCIAAGLHESLALIIGKVYDHPEGKHVLVMELIGSEFFNLGNPPNFETCTRDVFSGELVFYVDEILNISLSVVSASKHLHDKGIMHGDIYAHNTMVDSLGNALLGDFGAATPYNKWSEQAEAMEKLDVRAYGCLLDDLLRHVADDEEEKESINSIRNLLIECLQENVLARPNFDELYHSLIEIKDRIRLKHI